MLENAAELLVDIPKLWSYLSELICPLLRVVDISLLMLLIRQLRQSVPDSDRLYGNFLAEVLALAAKQMVCIDILLHILCVSISSVV